MLEVLQDNPTQWHFNVQERLILGYFIEKPKGGGEIDLFEEIEKMKVVDAAQTKMATIIAYNKLGIELPKDVKEPQKDTEDGKEEEKGV
jgi:hypothetical protein